MSPSGHKRKSRPCGAMSASPPKADIGRTFPEVRFVPTPEVAFEVLAVTQRLGHSGSPALRNASRKVRLRL